MKNLGFWKKLGDFALGKGFYIVLFLCVAAIGISGYYLLQTTVTDAGTPAQPAGGGASVTIPSQTQTPRPSGQADPDAQDRTPIQAQPDDPEPAARGPASEPAPEPASEPTAAEPDRTVSDVFTWPVKGTVLRDYSLETLLPDPTLGDWRTHGGLDIAAAEGVQVLAISAGTVSQVYEDDLMGTTVVVDHGGGLQSRYCNLAPETAVAQGDTVDIGAVLGTVGGTAILEVGMDPHLHLETTLDGVLVDPKEYLE